jgi:crotonobetainyl-CoA:carnitine CoA-transferase CaiB-like acyl-CoA transferase
MRPLQGIRVLDFSTLLPGPMATLMLAEAGAEVVKVERPSGDDMRHYPPGWNSGGGAAFSLLNHGKKSVVVDLNDPHAREAILAAIPRFDVIVEQFRPGVMKKFGLDYESVRAVNPRIIYCSITGYGQTGPLRRKAGHDINYLGDTGLLALSCGEVGGRALPQAPLADIAGGTYPAVINILLALRQRDLSGEGIHLDVSMTGNLFALMYLPWAQGHAAGDWPGNGTGTMTGASPRYNLYDAADGGVIVVAALEDKFWCRLAEIVHLEPEFADDKSNPRATRERLRAIFKLHDTAYWESLFATEDCCCSTMRSLQEALMDPHFSDLRATRTIKGMGGSQLPVLPLPLAPQFGGPDRTVAPGPILGSANDEFGL